MPLATKGAWVLSLDVACEEWWNARATRAALRSEIRRVIRKGLWHHITAVEFTYMRIVWRVEKLDGLLIGLKFTGYMGPEAVQMSWLARRRRKGNAFVARKLKVPKITLDLNGDGSLDTDFAMKYYERH